MEIKEELKTGDSIHVQLCTFGDVPNTTADGTKIVQRLTKESLENAMNSSRLPVRVDVDHRSETSDDTKAAGWIEKMNIEDDGLYGDVTVTEYGAGLLNGLDFRYGSPAFIMDSEGNPVELTSFALTNRPRIKNLSPVYNSNMVNNSEPESHIMDIKELIQLLGLPEEASADDVKNAIAGMIEKLKEIAAEEAEKQLEEQKAKEEELDRLLEEEAEAAVNEFDIDEEKKEEVVNCYKRHKELAMLFLGMMPKKTASVLNSADAQKPMIGNLRGELDRLPGGQARVDFIIKNYSNL